MPVPARHWQTASVIQPHERLPLPHPERVMGLTRAPASPRSPAVHELAGAQPGQPARDRRTQARADCCGPTSPACSDMQSSPRMIHRCARPSGSLIGSSIQNGGSARSYQELLVPFAVSTAVAGHAVSPYIYAASRLARTSGSAAYCAQLRRYAAVLQRRCFLDGTLSNDPRRSLAGQLRRPGSGSQSGCRAGLRPARKPLEWLVHQTVA